MVEERHIVDSQVIFGAKNVIFSWRPLFMDVIKYVKKLGAEKKVKFIQVKCGILVKW